MEPDGVVSKKPGQLMCVPMAAPTAYVTPAATAPSKSCRSPPYQSGLAVMRATNPPAMSNAI